MKKTILIVDDNSANRYMLKSLLEGEGLEVVAAENGKDALDKAHAEPPDLILSDILMPVMDGYTLCRQCKLDDQLKNIPFVFYTATYTEQKDEDFALSLGADRFILKPQEPEILIEILREFLAEQYTAKRALSKPLGEEMEFFRGHNEILFSKLESKMLDLELANQALRILEERYRLSFENTSDTIYTIDADSTISSVSPSAEKILGYKPQDLIGRSASDMAFILTPESFKRAIDDISLILTGKEIPAVIYEFVAKDGTIKTCEVSGSPMIRDGQIAGIISIARDITQRKKMEKDLEESEKRFRELVKYAPAGIYEADYQTGKLISVNDIMCDYTGYTREELLTMNLSNLLTEEGYKFMIQRVEKIYAGDKFPELVEYCIRKKDGNKLWGLTSVRNFYKDGTLKGATGIIYDITAKKEAENTLRENEEFLNSVIENIPDMIFVKNAEDLRYVRFNRTGEELLGYDRKDLIGKNDYDFFPREEANFFVEKDREVLRKLRLVDIPEEIIQTKHLGERILHTKKIPIIERGKKAKYLLGISQDITEHKLVEKERQQNFEKMRITLKATIDAMAMTVEARDPYTAGHQRRVSDLACAIATEMNLPKDQIEGIRMAGVVHDIGKISVPAEILSKPRKLTNIEFSLIKTHSQSGYDILKDIEFPWPIARMILEHHERMNGSGYPKGLTGDNLLVESKILAIADVVEAMASHRPYRSGLGIETALEEIMTHKGIRYDPDAVDACLKIFREKRFTINN